jgi:hypothetical protein
MSNDNTPSSTSTKPESKSAREKRVVAEWKGKLASNPLWAVRGLLAVYKYQTEAEKAVGAVTDDNGVGFAGVDGEFLSSLAKQYQQRGSLSVKQMAYLHKKMPKYAKQLWKAAGSPG